MIGTQEKLSWLGLSLIFGAENKRLWEVYEHYENAVSAFEAVMKNDVPNLNHNEIEAVKNIRKGYAEDIYNFCLKNKIKLITPDDSCYPEKLSAISCPPAVIYCMGDELSLCNSKALAVVGARKACSYSLRVAQKTAYDVSGYDVTIISGFANGIDTAAHSGAIEAGGKTVAVLGCGILYDYPKGKADLKNKISENGAVISEYPPLAPPQPIYFKVRNRIISGLSDGVLVVEAGSKSGSLNTAAHALEQGREVFVIPPHDIFSEKFKGQEELLSDGATEVYSARNIILNL